MKVSIKSKTHNKTYKERLKDYFNENGRASISYISEGDNSRVAYFFDGEIEVKFYDGEVRFRKYTSVQSWLNSFNLYEKTLKTLVIGELEVKEIEIKEVGYSE